jgi:hypothetical protein
VNLDRTEWAEILGFTPAWFTLGLVDDATLAQMKDEWEQGEDDNPEHYRYWAFGEFLKTHQPLSPETALDLFKLGDSDPDWSMGGAMMADILRLPECPAEVMQAAMLSWRKHLVRIVSRRNLGR